MTPNGWSIGVQANEDGHSKMIVDHKEWRDQALKRNKEGLGRNTA